MLSGQGGGAVRCSQRKNRIGEGWIGNGGTSGHEVRDGAVEESRQEALRA